MNKLPFKILVLLSLSLATLAQVELTQFANKCISCVQNTPNAPTFYCATSKKCYSITKAGESCGNSLDFCIANPNTKLNDYQINLLDIKNIATLTINQGESVQFRVKSQAEKSGFINITYDNPALKTDNNKVLFYVYNERLNTQKFEMSYLDSVLLPSSADNFIIWLGAKGNNFKVNVLASNSKNVVMGLGLLVIGMTASLFS